MSSKDKDRGQGAGLQFDTDWSYSPAPESTAQLRLRDRYELFIGGEFVAPEAGKYFATVNPATEQKIAEVAEAGGRRRGSRGQGRAQGLPAALVETQCGHRAANIFIALRARCRSGRASLR